MENNKKKVENNNDSKDKIKFHGYGADGKLRKIKSATAIGITVGEKREHNQKYLLQELEACMGLVNQACLKSKIPTSTYYKWYNEDSSFKAKADQILESQIDFAEAALFKKMKNGDTASIIFYLKTKGKRRGYTSKIEIDGNLTHSTSKEIVRAYDKMNEVEKNALLKLAEELDEDSIGLDED